MTVPSEFIDDYDVHLRKDPSFSASDTPTLTGYMPFDKPEVYAKAAVMPHEMIRRSQQGLDDLLVGFQRNAT